MLPLHTVLKDEYQFLVSFLSIASSVIMPVVEHLLKTVFMRVSDCICFTNICGTQKDRRDVGIVRCF